ncbi:MAG: hypothetical protein ACYTBP_16725 [Planctomycetota bacterium]|jgi:hypothetical protein
MKAMVREKHLTINEEANALDYLSRAGRFIKETENDLLAWKWVVLSLHGALYGFAVCACQGTDPRNVTYKTKKGDEMLISFDRALKLCQDNSRMKMLTYSKPLVLSQSQRDSIQLLKKELRNKFEHYIPIGWSIELHGMPQLAIDLLEVIRFLAIDTGTYIHLNQSQKRKIKSVVFQSKKFLKKTKLYKETPMGKNTA